MRVGTILTIDGLSAVRNERTLFRGLSLTLEAGEAMALTGPNGVGKTSLLRIVAGFLRPEAGTLSIAGDAEADLARRCQLVGSRDPLKAALSVRELLTGWRDMVFPGEAPAEAIDEALAALDLVRLAACLAPISHQASVGASRWPGSC